MIKIIAVGKIKEQYLNDLINDYAKRCNKHLKLEIIEVKDENDLLKEEQNILKYLNTKEYNVACDIDGKEYTSIGFAELIDKTFISYSTITFIIGGSEGLTNKIKELSNLRLSVSSMTFPHGLFRGILMEQIYRALKINNNETYHK